MARTSLSGFPEWLPEQRIVEQFVLDHLRRTFELHGFANIETRAVETLDDLEKKGETSKEVYVLERLQALRETEAGRHPGKERRIGLHFDLTVPLARYVVENANDLTFPFARYQIQKVWRGERPQEGRFREFTQADIDVVGQGTLPAHYEVDLPLVMAEALASLPIPRVRVLVNNRRVVQGVCEAIGVEDVEAALRGLDKLEKTGPDAVSEELARSGIDGQQAGVLLAMARIRSDSPEEVRQGIASLGVSGDLLDQGVAELTGLLATATARLPGAVVADLRIARGLDYYTGSVYESEVEGHEDLGSICSGGRYDSLAHDGSRTYPGVGLSIGVSRLVSRMLAVPLVRATRRVPTSVVVAVTAEEDRPNSDAVAAKLRSRGIATEVAPDAVKFGKQIRHADRRGIPFVWFPGADGQPDSVKDIRSGEQADADPDAWAPPAQDLWPRIEPVG